MYGHMDLSLSSVSNCCDFRCIPSPKINLKLSELATLKASQAGLVFKCVCVCMPLCSNLTFTAAVDLIYQNPSVDYATNPQKRVSNYLTKHNLVILLIKSIPP